MDEGVREFIEKMGVLFEADGMPRIAGRVLGLLVLSDDPQSLDALAGQLRVSKASVSTNARLLERLGAVARVTRPGDRRDYYRVAEGMPARMLEIRLRRVSRLRALMAQGLERIEGASPTIRQRLEELERFHGGVVERIRSALAQWKSTDAPAEEDGANPRRPALVG